MMIKTTAKEKAARKAHNASIRHYRRAHAKVNRLLLALFGAMKAHELAHTEYRKTASKLQKFDK
jgi:hypothetical protein